MIGSSVSLEVESIGTSATSGACVEICDALDGIAVFSKPDVELVLWRRALPRCLRTWLERMDASCLPNIRILVEPNALRLAIEPLLDECGMPKGDMRDLLVRDVEDLVSVFSRIAGTALVDVRLERVSHDACWKFHRDCVEERLLTTYRGPATEWVKPEHAATALRQQKRYIGPIERLCCGEVGLFKGSCAGDGRGIVHRSPPIAGTGATRLLLCLNRPSDTSPEPWTERARDA